MNRRKAPLQLCLQISVFCVVVFGTGACIYEEGFESVKAPSDASEAIQLGDSGDNDTGILPDGNGRADTHCGTGERLCQDQCVSIVDNPDHCGECGATCAQPPNAIAECRGRECVYECESGFSDADGDLGADDSNGCECRSSEVEVWIRDKDGDGWGNFESREKACSRPGSDYKKLSDLKPRGEETSPDEHGDCDDSNPDVHPGASEECDSREIDENCNGTANENCECRSGNSRECGPDQTRGACKKGTQVCKNSQWQQCEGAVFPSDETCDGKDNDCDGETDEQFPRKGSSCEVGKGVCKNAGRFRCNSAGDGVTCSASPNNSAKGGEICDGRDNDCDGQVDETSELTDRESCSKQKGVCQGAKRPCEAGRYVSCGPVEYGASYEPEETLCDQKDNDCDGQTDEVGQTWYEDLDGDGYGNPDQSKQRCSQPNDYVSSADDCNDACASCHPGESETCDGRDNDCDGTVDNGYRVGQPCSVGTGTCERSGTYQCTSDGSGTTCSATPGSPSTETCDGKDNDCDGEIDEEAPTWYIDDDGDGYGSNSETVEQCQQPNGYAANGDDCDDSCSACYPGGSEICDGRDNDCDQTVDETSELTDRKLCSEQDGVCRDSYRTCSNGSYDACGANEFGPDYESPETTCDDLDNDCDEVTDEGCSCHYRDKTRGVCEDGGTVEVDGDCSEPTDFESTETSCSDGKDNDCDGQSDCNDTDCHQQYECAHRMFVTSSQHYSAFATLGGFSDAHSYADATCSGLASNANLGGNWKAVLSDSSKNASDHISVDRAVYNLNGQKLARSETDLFDGSLENAVGYDENKDPITNEVRVWTGSNTSGDNKGFHCSDWTSTTSGYGAYGKLDASGSQWLDSGDVACSSTGSYRFYCIDRQ